MNLTIFSENEDIHQHSEEAKSDPLPIRLNSSSKDDKLLSDKNTSQQ